MDDPQGIVLLDVALGGEEEFDVSFLERTEHPVMVCHGPVEKVCPLLGGEGCPKFEMAHGIVFKLSLEDPQHREILRRYRELGRPDLPIRVMVDPERIGPYADLLADFELWWHEPTAADLDGFAAEVEASDRDQ